MYTIGDFSKLGHVSARMLRHYDIIGLLRPAHIGTENGYRYYDVAQLSTLRQIEQLKGYGFPLAQIPRLLILPPEQLVECIHSRRIQAYNELHELRKTLRKMEEELIRMEDINMSAMSAEKYHVISLKTPAQRVFGIRKTILVSETHDLFQELYREMEARGLKRAGTTQLLYHGEDFSYETMDVEAQVEVSGDHPDIQLLPEQFCAAVTHTGPYETLKFAYDAIGGWMAAHPEYKVCGPAIERYLKDEAAVNNPEELETGILFPISREE